MKRRPNSATGLALALAMAPALVTAWAGTARANGATASFPAGGVVFKPEKHVSIEHEDLDIAMDRIHVHYVFKSTAAEPLDLTIGFPLPKYPVGDDGPDYLGNRSASENDLKNYLAFKVKVDGRPLKPKLHQFAWLGDRNITLELQKMHIPPFTFPDSVGDKTLKKLPKSALNKLMKMKFVEQDGNDPTLYPRWDYQSVYEWQQSFNPGRTDVDVTYVPLAGDDSFANILSFDDMVAWGGKKYCFDDAFRKRVQSISGKNASFEPSPLGYILTTAKNWNGPIGEFDLKVTASDHEIFSFCPPAGLKPKGDGTHWVARNFVPDKDLKFAFFYYEIHK